MEGDRKYNIQTFATQMGVRNISLLVRWRASRATVQTCSHT